MKEQNDNTIKAELVELQSQLAFQEDVIQGLNEHVYELQQQLEKLSTRFTQVEEQLRQQSPEPIQATNEKPPHY